MYALSMLQQATFLMLSIRTFLMMFFRPGSLSQDQLKSACTDVIERQESFVNLPAVTKTKLYMDKIKVDHFKKNFAS